MEQRNKEDTKAGAKCNCTLSGIPVVPPITPPTGLLINTNNKPAPRLQLQSQTPRVNPRRLVLEVFGDEKYPRLPPRVESEVDTGYGQTTA